MGMNKENAAYIDQLMFGATITSIDLFENELSYVSGMVASLRIEQVISAEEFDLHNLRIKAARLNHHARMKK